MSIQMGFGRWEVGSGGRERQGRAALGFTILEIMIAVLILGLGLLGLGALFPVVIRSQRQGADASYGAMAADAAKATIQNMDYESALAFPHALPPRDIWRAWRVNDTGTVAVPAPATGGLNQPTHQHGQWLIPTTDNTTGAIEIGVPGSTVYSFELPVSQRLYPSASPSLAPPQFVWDFAIQRVDDGVDDGTITMTPYGPVTNSSLTDAMRVVVFVRRLDIRIRVAPGRNLYATVADGTVAGADHRVPVGVDNATGLPSNDGTGVYAGPITVGIQFQYTPARDRLYMRPTVTANQWAMVRQVGQKLVDNLGNIHTVNGSGEAGGRYVTLESSVPSYVTEDSADDITEAVLTPQIPAAVSVFRIEP